MWHLAHTRVIANGSNLTSNSLSTDVVIIFVNCFLHWKEIGIYFVVLICYRKLAEFCSRRWLHKLFDSCLEFTHLYRLFGSMLDILRNLQPRLQSLSSCGDLRIPLQAVNICCSHVFVFLDITYVAVFKFIYAIWQSDNILEIRSDWFQWVTNPWRFVFGHFLY